MTKKRLLFFASDYSIGLSALLTDQLISIVESGVEVCAVAGENEQESGLSDLLKQKGINIVRIHGLDTHSDFKRIVKEICNIVRDNKIRLIHVQNNWQLVIASFVKNRLLSKQRIKIVYTLHGFRNNNPLKSRIAQVIIGSGLLLLADHVICMTKYLRSKFKLLSYKIELIPLGIKDNFFTDKFIEPPIDAMHMVFPAQFRKGKNQDIIVRAFAKYVQASGDITSTLTLPGAGELEEEIKRLSRELGISRQINFPGLMSKEEIKNLYLNSNIAIVASNSETFGQSIVEPFVIGRCVVSTPVGIAPEIIKDGENGYLFKTEEDLYIILSQISRNMSSLKEIGLTNYNKHDSFSWSNVTSIYIDKLGLN